ncbi:hypothetical protein SERLA73DRAFT_60649, partial [Serpula lacrymans var. lacrymans S7.3]
GACVHCKSLKVRCEFNPGENVCQRCQAGQHSCVGRRRKKRKEAPSQEELQERSFAQDRHIKSLLQRLDQLKLEHRINSWMRSPQSNLDHRSGVVNIFASWSVSEVFCNPYYAFCAGSSSSLPPTIVKYCALLPTEIVDLFDMYVDFPASFLWRDPYFSVLDPEYHTAARLIWSSPFLFTVICAVAARHYNKRPNFYSLAMEFAKDAAGKTLIEPLKSVDICQAYLILSVYPEPKKKWADDRSWLLMGVAFRMAHDLGLDVPPADSMDERERLNRTRTWLNCFCVDGSYATQFGKSSLISLNDYLARCSGNWYMLSSLNQPTDIHLCGYVHLITVMLDFQAALRDPLENKKHADVVIIAIEYDQKLSQDFESWNRRFAEDPNCLEPICQYRAATFHLIVAYLRLVVLSMGFQNAVKSGISRHSYVVQQASKQSLYSASTAIQIMTERLFPSGRLRYALESYFLFVAFSASFLLNLLRSKFHPLTDEAEKRNIVYIVQKLIQVLGSSAVAVDGRHTPALYSRFLSSLLKKYDSTNRNSDSEGSVMGTVVHPTADHELSAHVSYWPYAMNASRGFPSEVSTHGSEYQTLDTIRQDRHEADMDFSMQHFISVVAAQPENRPIQQRLAQNSVRGASSVVLDDDYDYTSGVLVSGYSRGDFSPSGARSVMY